MKTVSTCACLCNNFQLMPGTHPGFRRGQLDSSCLLPWPTIHCVISNSSSKSCKGTTSTRRVFNTKYNIYRDLSITHSVHTELYHLIISKLICHSKAKAVPCNQLPNFLHMPTHLVLAPLPYMMSLRTLPTVNLTYKVQSTPNVMIPVEFTTTNVFIADIAMPCQLYHLFTVSISPFFWLAAHHSWKCFVGAKSSRLEPMQRTVFKVQIVARSTA